MNSKLILILVVVSVACGFVGGLIPRWFVEVKEKTVVAQEYRLMDSRDEFVGSISMKTIHGQPVIVYRDAAGKVVWPIPPAGSTVGLP